MQQFVDITLRHRADRGLAEATKAAKAQAERYAEIDPAVAERLRVGQERLRASTEAWKARKAAEAQRPQPSVRPRRVADLLHQPTPAASRGIHL